MSGDPPIVRYLELNDWSDVDPAVVIQLPPSFPQPQRADPGFDDSHWETVDLTPAEGSFDPLSGASGYVSGWTARGHAGYWATPHETELYVCQGQQQPL
ncbi:MAG TPA: hypothetical protein VI320_31150 [Terracidiphilus sp.]